MNSWTLFQDEPTKPPTGPSKHHRAMLSRNGKGPEGTTCGTCVHLIRHSMGNDWFKCALVAKGGPTTDWRKKWPACGKHKERE